MKSILLALLLFSLAPAKIINYSEKGFIFDIPGNWVEIPPDIIKAHFDSIGKSNPNLKIPSFECGFQLQSDKWLVLPYVLVQSNRTGRIPRSALLEMKSVNFDSTTSKINKSNRFIRNMEISETFYDSIYKIVWQKSFVEYNSSAKVAVITGMILTIYGTLNVYCYSAFNSEGKYDQVFENIIKLTQLSDSIKYIPSSVIPLYTTVNFLKSINWDKVIGSSIIIGILCVLTAIFDFVKHLKNRKKKI